MVTVGVSMPRMVQWGAAICSRQALEGTLALGTRGADHEAGELLQAGIKVGTLPTQGKAVTPTRTGTG